MYPTYIVELELQMDASVQACLSAEVEQAGAPAAKRQRTAGGANVARAGASVVGSSAAGSAARVPATPSVIQLVQQLRSGAAATKADAALKLGRISGRSETERSGIVAANAIGPLVALLQHGDANGKANSAFALSNLTLDGAHRGPIVAANAIGPLVALLQHGDARGKVYSAWALANLAVDGAHRGAIAAADAIGPLAALLQRGDADGKRFARLALDRLNALPPT
jgi:hypothetical protein